MTHSGKKDGVGDSVEGLEVAVVRQEMADMKDQIEAHMGASKVM